MLRERTRKLDETLVRISSLAGSGYTINRDYSAALRKVVGEPGVSPSQAHSHSDAAREALAALRIASIAQVERVLIGKDAYSYIHGNSGPMRKNCDVVGLLTGGTGAILGEGKGTRLLDALQQLTASAKALRERGREGAVRSALLVAPAPPYLECAAGLMTVTQGRGHWTLSEPHLAKQYRGALETANQIGLDPRYDYLLFSEEQASDQMAGLGLAVSKSGDTLLYSNRPWTGERLLPGWGPIRKLRLFGAEGAGVNLECVK